MDMKPSRRVARLAFGHNAGYLAAPGVLDQKPRPRALFVASDEQAFGVLRAAAQVGARVPDDLAIVGFDGLQEAGFTVPRAEHDAAAPRGGSRSGREDAPARDGGGSRPHGAAAGRPAAARLARMRGRLRRR